MSLLNLKLTPYSDLAFSTKAGSPWVAMLNPDNLSVKRNVKYNETQAKGSQTQAPNYDQSPPPDLTLDLIIDCTGVVDLTRTDMATEIAALQKVVYDYNSTKFKPNNVLIEWGTEEIMRGVLTDFGITYTLFHPLGKPLRAKVSLTFKQIAPPAAQTAAPPSALTKLVSLSADASLPALAALAAGSSALFVEVALANGLNKLRSLPSSGTLSL